MSFPVLTVTDLARHYRLPRRALFSEAPVVRAVDGVSFSLPAGRSLGLVGESGCGKSTLARTVMAVERPTRGRVEMLGHDLAELAPKALRRLRPNFQMVFQDPYGALDPRSTVRNIVAEPLSELRGVADMEGRITEVVEAVGLRAGDLNKYPHEFSGGQRQRIAIARALVTRPKLIVADEPVSALDVSVQATVLNLLLDLREQYQLSYLLISHDLAVVEYVCDEIVVMYRGRIVEHAPARELFERAAHPYTHLLLEAAPTIAPGRRRRRGASSARGEPGAEDWTRGCAFRARCARAGPRCAEVTPERTVVGRGHTVNCHFPMAPPCSGRMR